MREVYNRIHFGLKCTLAFLRGPKYTDDTSRFGYGYISYFRANYISWILVVWYITREHFFTIANQHDSWTYCAYSLCSVFHYVSDIERCTLKAALDSKEPFSFAVKARYIIQIRM